MSRKKKPREIRFCGCGCGKSKKVLVNSTWRYFAGHNLRVNNPMERPEVVAKMANTKRGRTKENHPGTAAQAEKMKGRTKENHPGKETRKKIGKSNSGSNNGMFGTIHSGENNHNWQGGISNKPYPFEFDSIFKELIRERYNHTCMICKRKQTQLNKI